MLYDLVLRFVLGGAIVSTFAIVGELFKPKTFGGMFGAAPSVGIASLALAFSQDSRRDILTKADWFGVGCLAMAVYCVGCIVVVKRTRVAVWIGAALTWGAWFATAALAWVAARGALPS